MRTLILSAFVACFAQPVPASQKQAEHRLPYVMPDACRLIELLDFEKIDGKWVGGRSIFRGQAPVTGKISKWFAKKSFYHFDAITFR